MLLLFPASMLRCTLRGRMLCTSESRCQRIEFNSWKCAGRRGDMHGHASTVAVYVALVSSTVIGGIGPGAVHGALGLRIPFGDVQHLYEWCLWAL